MDPISAGIIAGGGLLGGIMGSNSQKRANAANLDFAKNQVSYRVADAKRAGIHPLAALGMSAGSNPQQVGDTSMANAVSNAAGALGDARANKEINQLNAQLLQSQIESNKAQAHMYRSNAMETDFALLSANASQLGTARSPGTVTGGSNVNTINLAGNNSVATIPDRTPGQDVGDRYGDIAGEAAGMALGVEEIIIPAIREWWNNDIMNGVKEFERQYQKGPNRPAPTPKNYSRY